MIEKGTQSKLRILAIESDLLDVIAKHSGKKANYVEIDLALINTLKRNHEEMLRKLHRV